MEKLQLDYITLLRIAMWDHNRDVSESLTKELFIETYGKRMGEHYWSKWSSFYDRDFMKMISYFHSNVEDGQKFCDMCMKQMAKYEKHIGHKRKG